MAKALVRRSDPRVVVVSAPRRGVRRAGRALRRVARRAGRAGRRGLAPISVGIGGLIVGYADGAGYLSALPAIQGSRSITLGLVGWYASTHSNNPTIRGAGLAALASAAVEFGRNQARTSKGWGGDGYGQGYAAGADQYAYDAAGGDDYPQW